MQRGVTDACWAHTPKVAGSIPASAPNCDNTELAPSEHSSKPSEEKEKMVNR